MISLYADYETRKIIEKIKEENPDFILSRFVKMCLIEKGGDINLLDEAVILKNKRDAELKVQNDKNQVEYWDRVHQDYKVQQEIKRKEAIEREDEEKRKEEKKALAKTNVMETFKEETKRKMRDDEWELYNDNRSEYGNIWTFIDKEVRK